MIKFNFKPKKVLNNGNIISIIFYALTSIFSILFSIILTRLLGPDNAGKIFFSLLFLTTINIFFNLGFGQSIVFFINNKRYNSAIVLNLAFLCTIFISLISIPIIILFALYNHSIFKSLSYNWLLILIFITPFVNLKTLSEYYFASIKNFFLNTGINFFDIFLRILLALIFYFFIKNETSFFYSIIIATILCGTIPWIFIYSKMNFSFTFNILKIKIPGFFNYSLLSHISVLLAFLTLRSDQFFVSTLLSVSDLTYYIVALIIAELPFKLSTIISKVLFTTVANNNSDNKLTNTTIRATLITSLVISFFVMLFGKSFFVNFYGNDYLISYKILLFLIPGSILFNFTQVLQTHLSAKGNMNYNVITGIISLTVTILLNFYFTPIFGLISVAIISSFSYLLNAILSIYFYLKISKSNLKDILFFKKNDILLFFKSNNYV